VTPLGSTGTDIGAGLALDDNMDVLITGQFFGTVSFGTTILTASGAASDVFVAKLDNETGEVTWGKRFGGDEEEAANAVASNADGDIYIVGSFFGSVEFGSTSHTSAGEVDGFVTKLNESGEVVWSKRISGTGWDNALDVAADPSGDCLVTGYFSKSA